MAEYICPKCENVEEGFIRIIDAEVEQVFCHYDGEGLVLDEEFTTDTKKVISVECCKCNYKGTEPEFEKEITTMRVWRMICIYEEGNCDMPFKEIEEVPLGVTAEEVLENWINSVYGEGFKAGTISREELEYQFFYVNPIFGTRFDATEAPFGGTDSCTYAINNYRLTLCRMFEVPETFYISNERFFLKQREFLNQDVVKRGG